MTALAFLVGFWSLAAQFAFNRIIFFYLANSDFAAAAVITVHLSGFLAGTLIAPRTRMSLTTLLSIGLGLMLLAAGLCWRMGAPVFGLAATVTLTICFGVSIAAVSGGALIKLIEQARAGGQERAVVIADSAGSAVGAALAGFWLIPSAGLTASLGAVLALQALSVLLAAQREKRSILPALLVASLAAALWTIMLPPIHKDISTMRPSELAGQLVVDGLPLNDLPGRLAYSAGSPFGLVSVVEAPEETTMLLDNKPLCGISGRPLEEHFQYRLGATPAGMMRFTANPRMAIIGLGCGFTLEGVLRNLPRPASVEVIEINPAVPRAQKEFQDILPNTAKAALYELRIGDGFRHFAARTAEPYDLVVMDVSWMHDMVSTHLFSLEMFDSIRRNLSDDGVLTLHMAGSGPFSRSSRLVHRTLKAVFPYVYVDLADETTFFYATAREDVINYLSADGARISGWIDELDDEKSVNTLDRLPLSRERFRMLGPSDISEGFGF